MESVLIFGRGKYYERKKDAINKIYNIVGFLDNACGGKDTDVEGFPVYNPSKIGEIPNTKIVIMSKSVVDMHKQLIELGIRDELIDFGQNLAPAYDKIEDYCLKNKVAYKSENRKITVTCGEDKCQVESQNDLKNCTRKLMKRLNGDVISLSGLDISPIYGGFGSEMGTPIDRIYIERFISKHANFITGHVMEVEDNDYTNRFGKTVLESKISHVYGWNDSVLVNLESGEGVVENSLDCYILTQTLQFIYSLDFAVENIKKMLKPGGVALVTVCGISQISKVDSDNWGEYWRFTKQSCQKLFGNHFDEDKIEIEVYGNVKTATCFLYGLSAESIEKGDFEYCDDRYPVIIGIKATK